MTTPLNSLQRLTDPLGRYYTKQNASEAVIAHLGVSEVTRVVDLGCGDGSLSFAARNQWKTAEIITVDIDRPPRFLGHEDTPQALHRHFMCDALRSDLPDIIDAKKLLPDVAVCNPPFIRTAWQEAFSSILDDAHLGGVYKNSQDAITEILFLAQNIRILKNQGRLGIIVPDSLINGKRHAEFRKALIKTHTIESVVKLPRTAFQRTDAQAFILTIVKGTPTSGLIQLKQINDSGILSEAIHADPDSDDLRLDYGYHRLPRPTPQQTTLKALGAEVWRGKLNSSQRKTEHCFHITDFPKGNLRSGFDIPKIFWPSADDNASRARTGDILLSRVGRNLEDKICLVNSGVADVTDCVYIIRAPAIHRNRIFKSLSSGLAHLWLKEIAHGVSARQLPKTDLLNIPI